MRSRFTRALAGHVRQNLRVYGVVLACFITGTLVGAIGVGLLSSSQEVELASYLNILLAGIAETKIDASAMARSAVMNNWMAIFWLWLLGMTVVGAPVVLAIIFLRGFVIGFTVGFLVQKRAFQGFLLSLFTVLPQNLLVLPAMLVSAVAAVTFSWWLVKGRTGVRPTSLFQQFSAYTLLIACMGIVASVGGLVEAYLSPVLLQLIAVYFSPWFKL